jgi:hypothetical protein
MQRSRARGVQGRRRRLRGRGHRRHYAASDTIIVLHDARAPSFTPKQLPPQCGLEHTWLPYARSFFTRHVIVVPCIVVARGVFTDTPCTIHNQPKKQLQLKC